MLSVAVAVAVAVSVAAAVVPQIQPSPAAEPAQAALQAVAPNAPAEPLEVFHSICLFQCFYLMFRSYAFLLVFARLALLVFCVWSFALVFWPRCLFVCSSCSF